ncbi:hypothetical protein OUZ56_001101 [Daphnia magna]|uniref:Uncharacterized protein n=1 Tax=Daphnia magna TaxID=35525 RepID=A0ABR0A1N1_9CRUS|nr:hypothetical protein OUZ56_001101 [Daphnia magna]
MAAYGVSPVVTCLLSVADKNGCCRGNWRADKGARQFLSATESNIAGKPMFLKYIRRHYDRWISHFSENVVQDFRSIDTSIS